jgi:peptidoglycan/LPS O-acetylase OafA/YrhL
MDTHSLKRPHYPVLDGLRGVAVLLVVIYHYFDFTNYFFFGWLGVDLFFVLSGFLITDILITTVGQPGFLRNFFTRRVLRIFPLYYLTLLLVLFILPLFKNVHENIGYYQENQVWLWFYLQNWLYTFKPQYGSKILLHTWSLAVEEQFYLIWPLVVLLVRKTKMLLAISGGILLLVGVTRFVLWNLHLENFPYASLFLFTRIDGLCVGCMLALIMQIDSQFLKRNMAWIIIVLAIFNFLFYFFNQLYSPGSPFYAFVGYTTFAVLFGFLVFEGVQGNSQLINLAFNNSFLKFFGKISYGLYIYHWPAYVLLFPLFRNFYGGRLSIPDLPAKIAGACSVILICIIISELSFRYFESYFLRLKNKFT